MSRLTVGFAAAAALFLSLFKSEGQRTFDAAKPALCDAVDRGVAKAIQAEAAMPIKVANYIAIEVQLAFPKLPAEARPLVFSFIVVKIDNASGTINEQIKAAGETIKAKIRGARL